MIFARFFKRDEGPRPVERLYDTVVAQARMPAFYAELGVADTLDGRFDLLALHIHLVLRRLAQCEEATARGMGQGLFDTFFHDMDRSLRAMGVGDMSVGKRVKDMIRAYYGRTAAYEEALGTEAGTGVLAAAIARNVYAGATTPYAVALSAYAREVAAGLETLDVASLLAGEIVFPEVGGRV